MKPQFDLRSIVEHVPVAFCYVDRDLRMHLHNSRYAALAGLADDGIDGRTLDELVEPEILDLARDSIRSALRGRLVVYERPKSFRAGDAGSVRTTLVPHVDADGEVVGLFAMLQDITEGKQAENALRESEEKLESSNSKLRDAQTQLLQAAKLASIGQLASGVAHEINNPIGYVSSNLGTLEKYLDDVFGMLDRYAQAAESFADDDTKAALASARQSADIDFVRSDLLSLVAESKEGIARVKQIVADLKNFSRSSDDEDWQWSDLHSGIDSTLNIVRNELKYKADIRKEYGVLPPVQCRPSQLNQVFMNILVNAADAIRERGAITIRSGTAGAQVWIEFEDTGSGIVREHLARIFDPFFTTKPVGKGTGLGLAVSYGIVAEHNGRIDVASEAGKGAVFRVWLPAEQASSTAAAPA
jgi:PAS domain S-box-containing protein